MRWQALLGGTTGLVALSIGLTACGGAAPPARAAAPAPKVAAAPPAAPKAAAPVLEGVLGPEMELGAGLRIDLLRAAGPRRARVAPEPFPVVDLPLGMIPAQLPVALTPEAVGSTEGAPELLVDWAALTPEAKRIRATNGHTSVRVTLKNQALGRVRIGAREGFVTLDGGGGMYVTCGGEQRGRSMIQPARWEWLSMEAGEMRLNVADAWFDTQQCKASVVTRTQVRARALPGGLLFAFRECEGASAGSSAPAAPAPVGSIGAPPPAAEAGQPCRREVVTFIWPRAQQVAASGVGGAARTAIGGFSRVSLPLQRGGGGSFMGRVAVAALNDWHSTTGTKAALQGDLVVGVEIVQGVDDPEPLGIAYAAVAPPPGNNRSFGRRF